MSAILEVLRRPIVTEKSNLLAEAQNKYVFEVALWANKIQIKDAVQQAFEVEVTKVNVINMPGKMRRVGKTRGMTKPWRKAIVTVQPGQKIELFEGV